MNKTFRLTIFGITICLFSALSLKLNAAQPQPKFPALEGLTEEIQKIFPAQEAQAIFNEFYTKLSGFASLEATQLEQKTSELISETAPKLLNLNINPAAFDNLIKNLIKNPMCSSFIQKLADKLKPQAAILIKNDTPLVVCISIIVVLLGLVLPILVSMPSFCSKQSNPDINECINTFICTFIKTFSTNSSFNCTR